MPSLFISATGTEVGKTWLTRGLARSLARAQHSVAALKPIETGVASHAADAVAIARASGHPRDARLPHSYRASPPLAPYAIQLRGDHDELIMGPLLSMIKTRERQVDWLLVEAAGGLLVPLTHTQTIADLARRLDFPTLLVSTDHLGTLSHSLTAMESARARHIPVAAVVLMKCSSEAPGSNYDVLSRLLAPTPVFGFRHTRDDDDALADEAERCGLIAELLRT